eukprot:TRINITY_DN2234_c0_g1_i2.p1 TRINITY_DN2234_c0_g1~~TRINITY_DN2234_c0_g1_i2.p1  ORF type:complete len:409 (+),score=76.08 TRINITY_DN2234_c0_g1_i2:56-1228(+)
MSDKENRSKDKHGRRNSKIKSRELRPWEFSESSSYEIDDCGCWGNCCNESSLVNWCRTRDIVYRFFDDESSSIGATIYAVINFLVIIESIIIFVILSDPVNWLNPDPIFFYIEVCNIGFFTIDFVVKFLLTRQNRCKWISNFFNIADFLAIAPFYIELMFVFLEGLSALAVLRVLRLLRIIRILKLLKFLDGINIVMKAVKKSAGAFLLLVFSITVTVTLFGTIMFYAEQTRSVFNETEKVWYYDDGEVSPFQNIPSGFWWAIVTITTVGYGDLYPYSEVGRIVASVLMVFGILVLVFPLTIIGSNFSEVYDKNQAQNQEVYLNNKKTNIKRLRKKGNLTDMVTALELEIQRISTTIDRLSGEMESIAGMYEDIQQIASILAEELVEDEE